MVGFGINCSGLSFFSRAVKLMLVSLPLEVIERTFILIKRGETELKTNSRRVTQTAD